MNIVFVSKRQDDPTTRYRVAPLMNRLSDMGASVQLIDQTSGVLNKWRLRQQLGLADLIFVQRRALPNWVLPKNTPLIFDLDDAIFAHSNGEASSNRRKQVARMVVRSSLVVAGNQFLADHCSAEPTAGRVMVAPTAVAPVDRKHHAGPATRLVWIGSKSTARYLLTHTEMLNAIGQQFPGMQLDVVADFDLHLDDLNVNNIPWSETAEAEALRNADIGIAPMIDNTWTRGKCALKVLQYMSAGLPVVSSAVGANCEVIVDGKTGVLADQTSDWTQAIANLMDPDKRQKLGDAGYERLVSRYAPDPVFSSIIEAMTSLDLLKK